jgi:hypothetical protein
MWTSRDTGAAAAFPVVPWALPVAGSRTATGGDWNWEYGMNLSTIYDADGDSDGLCNAAEYLAGTDPTDARSTFSIRELVGGGEAGQPAPDALALRWPSLEGRVYDVLWTETLGGAFSPIATGVPATLPSNSFTVNTAGHAAGFFKIVVRTAE